MGLVFGCKKKKNMNYRERERKGTCSRRSDDVVVADVSGVKNNSGFVVRISGVKFRERHVDTTQPHLPDPTLKIHHHAHVHRRHGRRILSSGRERRRTQ